MIKSLLTHPLALKFFINCYPPLWFTGIWVDDIAKDYFTAQVSMSFRFYNRNYVRTQFGGSLYAMTDPMYMIMLMHILGDDYIVWDKAGAIDYIKPGRSKVTAHFQITQAQVDDIRQKTAEGEKCFPEFVVNIVDEKQELIAKVSRTIYVRKKKK